VKIKHYIQLVVIVLISCTGSFSQVLDSMESVSDWSSGSDSGASLSVTSVNGYSSKAVKLDYSFDSGSWVQVNRDLSGADLSGGDSIRFYYRGTGASNNVEIKVYDSDDDIFSYTFNGITSQASWISATVLRNKFTLWTDSDDNPLGDGTADWDSVTKVAIGITKNSGGSGTLDIDNLTLYQQNTPTVYTIDDCENRTNSFGNYVTTYSDTGSGWAAIELKSAEPSPAGGNYYKISYDTGTSIWVVGADEKLDIGGVNFDASEYLYLNLFLKAETLNEVPLLEVYDSSGNDTIVLSDYKTLSRDWTFYSIPFTDFTIDTSDFKQIKFVFKKEKGAIYVDNLWFSEYNSTITATGPVKTFNQLEGPFTSLSMPTYTDKDAVLNLSSVSGYSGDAMRMDYDFKSGSWMLAEAMTGFNLAETSGLKFKYKGDGINSNLEFKLEDMDDVVFYKKFKNFTDTSGEWRTAVLYYNETSLFSEGSDNDETLDLKNIKKIYFALSKSDDEGSGTFYIDEIETLSGEDFKLDRPGKIIESVTVNNNPFSPDSDGVKDTASFILYVSDYCDIILDVYDPAGELVRSIKLGGQQGNVTSLKWDGKDDSGSVVKNGIYFYIIKAKTPDFKEDSYRHIIGVIK